MEKIVNLEKRGLVLAFDDFVNEKLEVSIRPDKIIIAPNKECYDAVWSILEQECGGDAEVLKDYLEQEYDIESPSMEDIIKHIMSLVDDYFNAGVEILHGEQYILPDKKTDFIKRLEQIDYKMVIEDLVRELFKVENTPESYPSYCKEIEQICNECVPENNY